MIPLDLFDSPTPHPDGTRQLLAPGAMLLHQFARSLDGDLLQAIEAVVAQAPLRHMQTPGGYTMSVATTSCGALGWVSDARGYRYVACDPLSGQAWPTMPTCFVDLAQRAAADAGYSGFEPESCLINTYMPGAKLSLHQDKDEKDLSSPIVSVSLGLPAVFLFGGAQRSERPQRYRLEHGDVVVWGGPSRLQYHGVLAIKDGWHPMTGACRVNVTFRRAAV